MNRDERTSGSQSGVAAAADPMVGQVLDGRYRLTVRLGEGGMGEVYAAEHVHIEKRVAIKLLRSEILTNQEAVTRFRQEARSASSIGHRNIITIEDFGQLPDGRIYLAMELLHGAPLSDLLKQQNPPERLLHILVQTGHGLAAAHKKGIVHRDMKPENVFVTFTPDGEDVPKLLDFGIAKVSGADGNNHLTRTGTIFGTPFYMAPEQALGQNVDHRADIYAMGVIMYEVFGGAVPFQGESFMGILTQHITAEPRPPAHMAAEHGRSLPPGVEEIILRAMRKDPDQRYQTMDELVAALVGAYRGIAGPGMSGYLASHPSSGTLQAMPGHGYQGRSGAISAPPPQGARGAAMHTPSHYSTPQGHMGPVGRGEGSVRYPVPMPDPQFTSGQHSAADSGAMPRRKSRAGLIAILFVIMAAAGSGI
ncbi:MAG TPA: serine/threonine-protein kinase, partial [Kofleriaceae bacterium]|nr:serine/threonine-protein kinase [Kofleriaceae bacterium]